MGFSDTDQEIMENAAVSVRLRKKKKGVMNNGIFGRPRNTAVARENLVAAQQKTAHLVLTKPSIRRRRRYADHPPEEP